MSAFADRENPDVLCLFDVDGTLTVPRSVRATCRLPHAPMCALVASLVLCIAKHLAAPLRLRSASPPFWWLLFR